MINGSLLSAKVDERIHCYGCCASLAKEGGAMDKISSTHRQQLLIRILLAIDG
jgi:hypothetical protein